MAEPSGPGSAANAPGPGRSSFRRSTPRACASAPDRSHEMERPRPSCSGTARAGAARILIAGHDGTLFGSVDRATHNRLSSGINATVALIGFDPIRRWLMQRAVDGGGEGTAGRAGRGGHAVSGDLRGDRSGSVDDPAQHQLPGPAAATGTEAVAVAVEPGRTRGDLEGCRGGRVAAGDRQAVGSGTVDGVSRGRRQRWRSPLSGRRRGPGRAQSGPAARSRRSWRCTPSCARWSRPSSSCGGRPSRSRVGCRRPIPTVRRCGCRTRRSTCRCSCSPAAPCARS